MTDPSVSFRRLALGLALALAMPMALAQSRSDYSGDFIAAVVNNDLVTAGEIEQRVQRAQAAAARGGQPTPSPQQLRKDVVDQLIDERVLVTYARDSGAKVEEAELDRAMQSIAAQNQWTLDQLRDRLRAEGVDYTRFRANLRDQMLIERVREREVGQRTRITDLEIDDYLARQNSVTAKDEELDIAQILIAVPEDADIATQVQRKARIDRALARVQAGEDFATVAREMSEDGNRANGGAIGLKPVSRLPDAFVAAVRDLKPGEVAPNLLRTGAGWHVLKLLERTDTTGVRVTQTHPRHILLRPSAQLSVDAARVRMAEYRAQIERGAATFEAMAREYSEDGSAAQGGDLGWVSPGALVPEFEEAMNQLPLNGVSQPVVSRFGVHLIQVLERREITLDAKAVREQARMALRGQKFEEAYREWLKELRGRAYIEMREPPQ
jgi:peptidyl-prolyl cis-trans isomerase SurA